MPTTRKKVIKTVYKDEDSEEETGDFSDSGSEAKISEQSSEEDEDIEDNKSSSEEFDKKGGRQRKKQPVKRRPKFAKELISKINKQMPGDIEETDVTPAFFTVKDLTAADKLLPSVLNLSESDSSDDESSKAPSKKKVAATIPSPIQERDTESEEDHNEYKDVWTSNVHDNSAEIAKKTFMELEQHKTAIEETKASVQMYLGQNNIEEVKESNVKDLLALGEEVTPVKSPVKKKRTKKVKNDSESEVEDWEEVKESKSIPQQGLQLVVALPDAVCRKSKKIDVEMMMKRKINRVKKEHQVFMHKVHVLCWLGHGNYVNRILNDQEIMAEALSIVPKNCYPEERLNMKYAEQITTWFKDKLTLNQDKNENKFKPKAPPLKAILLDQIKKRIVTANKYSVFIFVAILRALGLQCRIMFNFVTVPLKPPVSELCSLSIKPKEEKVKAEKTKSPKTKACTSKAKNKPSEKIPQVDGNYDSFSFSDSDYENILQLDGSDDTLSTKTKSLRTTRARKVEAANNSNPKENEGVSPPKRARKNAKPVKETSETELNTKREPSRSPQRKNLNKNKGVNNSCEANKVTDTTTHELNTKKIKGAAISNKMSDEPDIKEKVGIEKLTQNSVSPRKTRSKGNTSSANETSTSKQIVNLKKVTSKKIIPPKIVISDENHDSTESKYFGAESNKLALNVRSSRKRSNTAVVKETEKLLDSNKKVPKAKTRTKSTPGSVVEKSKYFSNFEIDAKKPKLNAQLKKQAKLEDAQRVSHKDLIKSDAKPNNDITGDLVDIIKNRIKGAKEDAKKKIVKGKVKEESDESDYLPIEDPKRRNSGSSDDFKPTKISPRAPKPGPSKKHLDRRVLSSDEESKNIKTVDVWCEVFVEELEQWIAIDVVKGKVFCSKELYSHATHPVCYVVGWDNNNYLKDLTRRYVPHWNTVTRKQRAEVTWWNEAVAPWLGPRNARDREEDESLDKMQLEAPLPKSIAEYKNHPLYALKRHLLKFEVIYPADAATLGFVRSEPVYSRHCVHTCRSRDTWLKEAKVVRLGEQPYKVVKARPKWDKLSNKLITDKPLEVFGPWQVQDYEPPVAENGMVPRNAYGNVELFKECMLPKGTVHIKLPGLNKVARKLNIDCAPAMTGFDFNGGWSHPVYDGFVVCQEFEEIVTEAWVKDQEEQVRKEQEKLELRVYGNWKRLIKGLFIRERLKAKYGFEDPSTSNAAKTKSKAPKFVAKKK